jgi:ApeA N-terminal domain 1
VAEDFTGRFWFADAPDTAVPGRLTWNDQWPRVELLGALSPARDEHPTGSGHYIDAQPNPPRTIHGSTLGTPSKVTLFNAVVSNHTTNMLTFNPLEPDNAVQIQTFRGTCAILGAHVDDLAATFPKLRYRIQRQRRLGRVFRAIRSDTAEPPHRHISIP